MLRSDGGGCYRSDTKNKANDTVAESEKRVDDPLNMLANKPGAAIRVIHNANHSRRQNQCPILVHATASQRR